MLSGSKITYFSRRGQTETPFGTKKRRRGLRRRPSKDASAFCAWRLGRRPLAVCVPPCGGAGKHGLGRRGRGTGCAAHLDRAGCGACCRERCVALGGKVGAGQHKTHIRSDQMCVLRCLSRRACMWADIRRRMRRCASTKITSASRRMDPSRRRFPRWQVCPRAAASPARG